MRTHLRARPGSLLAVSLFAATLAAVAITAEEPASQKQQKAALSQMQVLIGEWRGVGQPKRGSARDSWIEAAGWQWSFDEGQPALVFDAPKGRFYRQGRLTALDEEGHFQLDATRADDDQVDLFRGSLDEDHQLTLLAATEDIDPVARITMRTVADGDRLLILLERQRTPSGPYSRIAEVGYTREGSGFGQGNTQRECIVTGGLGSTAVTYMGETYYVCCGGCRELFEEDPEGVLEDYRQRLAERKAKEEAERE